MKSHSDDNKLETAPSSQPAPAPAPAPHHEPAPTKPELSLEERVAKLERYIPRIEALLGGP